MQARANLERVRNLVTQHTAKHDEDRTTTFLYAATRGDVALIRQVCSLGRLQVGLTGRSPASLLPPVSRSYHLLAASLSSLPADLGGW